MTSHRPEYLKEENPPVVSALDFFTCVKPNLTLRLTLQLATIFPPILKIPTAHTRTMWMLKNYVAKIAGDILERANSDPDAGRSMVGALGIVLHFVSDRVITVDQHYCQLDLKLPLLCRTTRLWLRYVHFYNACFLFED
jgi:hypothetical protein